jgi:putative tryptophan/tyrosine transport system substrate-binding protein
MQERGSINLKTARALGLKIPQSLLDLGGLLSYGTHLADLSRRGTQYVDKILKDANLGDLPIEQPTKFELIINLKPAQALGITIPQAMLLRAAEVMQ